MNISNRRLSAIYLIQICGLLLIQRTTSKGTLHPECVENCNIVNNEIVAWEGKNVTLKYTATFTRPDFEYELEFDSSRVLKFISNDATSVTVRNTAPPPLDFIKDKSVVKTGNDVIFYVVIPSLNRTTHHGKILLSELGWEDNNGKFVKESSQLTLNVYYGPTVVDGLLSRYNVVENGTGVRVNVTILGHPVPVLNATGTDRNFPAHNMGDGKYRYELHMQANRYTCDKLVKFTAQVDDQRMDLGTTLHVLFTPTVPVVKSAKFDTDNCLHVVWEGVESGDCSVSYTLNYIFHNGTWNHTIVNTATIKHCFPDTRANGTVQVSATAGQLSSGFSSPFGVVETPDPTLPPSTAAPVTGADVGAATGGRNDSIEWYYILIIVIAGLILILILTCIVLVCTGRLTCWSCCYVKSKGSGSGHVNGIENPDYEAEFEMKHSVRHLSNAAGLTRPADRDKPKTDAKADTKEGDYVDVRSMEKPKQQPSPDPSTDYAELGPGGRAGEKPKVAPSFYAQVNTDDTYYPPLNPDNKHPPLYAVSSKARPVAGGDVPARNSVAPVEPVYMSTQRPPSEYTDDDTNPITV